MVRDSSDSWASGTPCSASAPRRCSPRSSKGCINLLYNDVPTRNFISTTLLVLWVLMPWVLGWEQCVALPVTGGCAGVSFRGCHLRLVAYLVPCSWRPRKSSRVHSSRSLNSLSSKTVQLASANPDKYAFYFRVDDFISIWKFRLASEACG